MADVSSQSPETLLAAGDPGDEISSRFRFQWTWAAVVCCMLLDDSQDVQEVYCEHHEDVLLKHRDGTLTGHQVKTRGDDQPLWKAKDESVLAACVRFARLEAAYTGKFRRFCFLTNHPIYSSGNGQDLVYLLESVREAASLGEVPSNVAKWVKRVAREADVSDATAYSALSKTEASASLPKLYDADMRLMHALADCWPPAVDCSHAAVRRSAHALIDECGRASSLHHLQSLPAYMTGAADGNAQMAARIDGKRMTLARVERVLERGRDSKATLAGDPRRTVEPGEGSTELLHKKLDAGGFSLVSRNSAQDLRDKADYLGLAWTSKYGRTRGLQRYDHVRSLVLSDAGRAFDTTRSEVHSFGPAMREELCRRFRDRRAAGDELFDTTIDHLEGFAFSLTSQCQVVWSHARPWELE